MPRPLLANLYPVLQRVRAADHILLAVDFDGSLSPIVPRPEVAVLPAATAARLETLIRSGGVSLAVISGRALDDVRRRVGLSAVYAGNHGLEIEGPGVAFRHPEAGLRRADLDRVCGEVQAALGGIEGAFVEHKGLSATVHFRLVEPCLQQSVRSAITLAMRPYAGSFDVLPALKAWELRPRIDWDKGDALRFILDHRGAPRPLVICAGDDEGDEPMFQAVPDAVSIRVGDAAPTSAQYSVSTPAELVVFLGMLAAR